MKVSTSRLISGIKVIVVLILFAVTILSFNMINRYEVSGDELLVNNNFDKNFEGWYKTDDGIAVMNDMQPVVRLISKNDQKIVSIRQMLNGVIEKGQQVMFSAMVKTEGVRYGVKAWNAARIIFVAMDEDGRSVYNLPHILVALNGTNDWEHFSKVFVAMSNTARYYVEIQLVNVKGIVWVKELSLQPVKETLAFSLLWMVSVLLWVVVTLWILVPHRRTVFASKWNVLIMVMCIFALIGALIPVSLKYSAVESMKLFFPWIVGEAWFFSVGHFLVYSMLSFIIFWKILTYHQLIARLGLLILFAIATEILQFLVEGRTPRVSDFFVDVSGMVLGLFIARLFSPYNLKRGVG